MASKILLPDQLYERLAHKSQQLQRTPDELVAELLEAYLNDANDQWLLEFERLLSQIHTKTSAYSSKEIEEDITAAATEARELRRARRTS